MLDRSRSLLPDAGLTIADGAHGAYMMGDFASAVVATPDAGAAQVIWIR